MKKKNCMYILLFLHIVVFLLFFFAGLHINLKIKKFILRNVFPYVIGLDSIQKCSIHSYSEQYANNLYFSQLQVCKYRNINVLHVNIGEAFSKLMKAPSISCTLSYPQLPLGKVLYVVFVILCIIIYMCSYVCSVLKST